MAAVQTATSELLIAEEPGTNGAAALPRDDREHVIGVAAHGYVRRVTKVRFTRDVMLEVALEKVAPAAARPPAPAADPGAPRVRLDPADPWRH